MELPSQYRLMTPEEEYTYVSAVNNSAGFDVPNFPGATLPTTGMIVPVIDGDPARARRLTKFAINHHNQETGENLRLTKLVKWNIQAACPLRFYITFEARDATTRGAPPLVYQALVENSFPPFGDKVVRFRRRPEGPGASSSSPPIIIYR